jgi:DNA primase
MCFRGGNGVSWYSKVNKYIDDNLMDFIKEFFGANANTEKIARAIRVSPAPCCGHNDCFSFATEKNAFNCFSCRKSGNRIKSLQYLFGNEKDANKALSKWAGVEYLEDRVYDEQTRKKMEKEERLQELYRIAILHYTFQMQDETESTALAMQTGKEHGCRKHQLDFLKKYKVGYSSGWDFLRNALEKSPKGFTKEEIEEAKSFISIPEGYFVYPYYDKAGNLIRINTKLFERKCLGSYDRDTGRYGYDCGYRTKDLSKKSRETHEHLKKHKMAGDGFSRGEKTNAFYFDPESIQRKRFAILVEGENDVISADEEMANLPESYRRDFAIIGLGGQMDEESFESLFLRQFEKIYECFDHDDAGDKYRNLLDEKLPDVPVYSILFDDDINDIDAWLKSHLYNPGDFKDAIDNAAYRDTKHYIIERETSKHHWRLKNRQFEITFDVSKANHQKGTIDGTISVYKGGQPTFKKTGDLMNTKIDPALNTTKLLFAEEVDKYYNDVEMVADKPKRSYWELINIFKYTSKQNQVIRQLAWYLHQKDIKEFQAAASKLGALGQEVKAQILQEVNSIENQQFDPNITPPIITLSQFFNIPNNDAFFYFSKIINEEDVTKAVPCLITNKKEEIRLDLMKKSDPQSILLIKNKYQLPTEVPITIMNQNEVSLQRYWVERWKNEQLDPAEYDPSKLIKEIEDFIRGSYYLHDDTLKVLSLWIYSTYFYMLFQSGFPYLLITGEKGTGKSTADFLIYLLSLNPKFALHMSESSLFRAISQQGGTFILDELENLTDKKSVDGNAFATILKGGYSNFGRIYRTNMENGIAMIEEHSAFGPKVISNINGLDDVIGDRCIFIKTARAPESKLKFLKDPQIYREQERSKAHSITSRCVISALEYFQTVNEIYNDANNKVMTGNARLSQIILPLVAMAKFVGGDYEEALMRFYRDDIAPVKEELSVSTQEGMVKNILKIVAQELTGIRESKWATNEKIHTHTVPITYHRETGIFEMDLLHFMVLGEESNDGIELELKSLRNTIKMIFKSATDFKNSATPKNLTIHDESLQRRLNNQKNIRTTLFRFNVNDYLSESEKQTLHNNSVPETSLF